MTYALISLLVLFLLTASFFSASETALFSLSSMQIKAFKGAGDLRKTRVAALLARPRDLLVTVIMVNITLSIFVQNIVSTLFGDFSSWLLRVGLPLLLVLVFADVIPKSIALAYNTAVALSAAPALDKAAHFLFPLRKALVAVTGVVSHCLFFFLRKEREISVDELQHALRTSHQLGLLQTEEAELAHGYLRLEEGLVKEYMRPREEVLFFEIDEPLEKLIHLFVDQECSRIPICRHGFDDLLGVMTSRLFFLHRDKIHVTADLVPLLKKPFFVPESTSARALLQEMYEKKEPIAMVVDEYGSCCGLLSLEDLVEVVVGEIKDRRDEKSRYTLSGEGVMIASGKLELAEFTAVFGVELESPNHMLTLGGWLTEQFGDIPKAGTKLTASNLLFHVLAADPTRVRRVYVRRLKGGK